MSRPSLPLLLASLLVLLLALSSFPSPVAAGDSTDLAHRPSHSSHSSSRDSFACRLAAAEEQLSAAVVALTRSQLRLHRLASEVDALQCRYDSLVRRVQALRHELATGGDCKAEQCLALQRRLEAKLDQLSALLAAICPQLAALHADAAKAHAQACALQTQVECAVKLLHQLRASGCPCDERDGRLALLGQLEAALAAICPAQAALDAALGCLQRDVAAVECRLVAADALWSEASALFLALLRCRRDAKELAFLDWAERQAHHLQCRSHAARETAERQTRRLACLRAQLATIQHTLQRLDAACPGGQLSCKDSATCCAARRDVFLDVVHSLHAAIAELQRQACLVDTRLTRIGAQLHAQLAQLDAVDRVGCEVLALIKQWREALHGSGADAEACREQEEGKWRRAILHGLGEMEKTLGSVEREEGVIERELKAAASDVEDLDGCGLTHVGRRGLTIASFQNVGIECWRDLDCPWMAARPT